jgi:hypothetical protein
MKTWNCLGMNDNEVNYYSRARKHFLIRNRAPKSAAKQGPKNRFHVKIGDDFMKIRGIVD